MEWQEVNGQIYGYVANTLGKPAYVTNSNRMEIPIGAFLPVTASAIQGNV